MEMGRERPRSSPAIVAPRAADGVAHAPLSVPTVSGRMCPNLCPDRPPILSTIFRRFWVAKCGMFHVSSTLSA
jgi:hypothetical protein